MAIKKTGEGWACITWPKAYDGRGGTLMKNIVFRQEQAKFDTAVDIFLIGLGLAEPTLMVRGTE